MLNELRHIPVSRRADVASELLPAAKQLVEEARAKGASEAIVRESERLLYQLLEVIEESRAEEKKLREEILAENQGSDID
jgi:hypothetical protein